MNPLEPGQLGLMRVQAIGGAAAALIAVSIAEVVNAAIGLIPSGIIVSVVALLLIYPTFIAPGRLFRSWGWKSEDEELHLAYGIWTKMETIVPFRRVQHIDVRQNALERTFGVTALVLHTAGTLNSRVVLPGLSRETAEAIRDEARAVIARESDV